MPQIIVTAGPSETQNEGAVMLRERVSAADFESERFAANLVERLGWAVLDATEQEGHEVDQEPATGRAASAPASQREPVKEPVTA
jgi:hypothetical protein